MNPPVLWDNRSAPGGAGNTIRGLTRSTSTMAKEGLPMKGTQCRIPGCEKPRKGNNSTCSMHTARISRHGDPDYVTPTVRRDPVERFWEKVDKRGVDECWPWLGTVLSTGYGQFKADGRRYMAHRYAYELAAGPIPEGLHLDHVRARGCTMTQCVNPAHLEPVTPEENWRRGSAPSVGNQAKTRCPKGHAYDKVATRTNGKEYRMCLTCSREALRRSRARRKAAQ